MSAALALAGFLVLAGCEEPVTPGPQTPPGGAGATAGSGGAQVDGETPTPPDDPALAAIAARLPDDWTGTGVLARRDAVPADAPPWVSIVAEVIDDGGGRYLRASGMAPRIRNSSLARSAAANRARALIAEWLGTQTLEGAEIVAYYGIPGNTTYALAQIEVTPDWQPGRPHATDSATPTPSPTPPATP